MLIVDWLPYVKALDIFVDCKSHRGLTAQAMKMSASVALKGNSTKIDPKILDEMFVEDILDDSG